MDHSHHHSDTAAESSGFFDNLLQVYVPRQQCMFHQADVIWMHVIADALTALAYYSIPVALVYFAQRRKDLAYHWVFLAFAMFIILCGTTHLFSILAVWQPLYKLEGLVKLLTGVISIGVAICVWRLMPHALALPSQAELVRRRDELEILVQQRTAELVRANEALKESEQISRSLAQKALEASQTKSEFLANMSHELRTPMNVVIGISSIMARSEPLSDKQREWIRTLQISADSLLALINDLLDISKIEAKSVELEYIPFSPEALIQEVMGMLAMDIQQKNLDLHVNTQEIAGYQFLGDPARVRQVIMNLCSNAVKFTPAGEIRIATGLRHLGKEKYEVTVSVQDTGIGIAPDKIETIFEKFVQGDSSITRRYGGTGLGLAITKMLVDIMGGTLGVKSVEAQGSSFTLTLPLVRVEEAVTGTSSVPFGSSQTESGRVLVVEDQAPNRMVMTSFLEHLGYQFDIATNGAEALERAKTGRYACILMDVQMQEMNGLEATHRIREYEASQGKHRVPIIGVTALALKGDRERCLEAGMDDYIAKPFVPEELQEKLAFYGV